MSHALHTLPVGTSRTAEPVAAVRTPAQHNAVRTIVTSDEFAFACGNPFTPEVGDYTGPFAFLWYDTSDVLHVVRIGKRGNTLRHATAA